MERRAEAEAWNARDRDINPFIIAKLALNQNHTRHILYTDHKGERETKHYSPLGYPRRNASSRSARLVPILRAPCDNSHEDDRSKNLHRFRRESDFNC
jgi:hypothetical protein